MSQHTRTDSLSRTGAFAAAIIGIGGGYELHAVPQAVLAGAAELCRNVVSWARALANVPSAEQGSFLQPPQGSHFSPEV